MSETETELKDTKLYEICSEVLRVKLNAIREADKKLKDLVWNRYVRTNLSAIPDDAWSQERDEAKIKEQHDISVKLDADYNVARKEMGKLFGENGVDLFLGLSEE